MSTKTKMRRLLALVLGVSAGACACVAPPALAAFSLIKPAPAPAPPPQDIPTAAAPIDPPPVLSPVRGFQKDVPLTAAIAAVVPFSLRVQFAAGVDIHKNVTWHGGGRSWKVVLDDALAPVGLMAIEDHGQLTVALIEPATTASPEVAAPPTTDPTFTFDIRSGRSLSQQLQAMAELAGYHFISDDDLRVDWPVAYSGEYTGTFRDALSYVVSAYQQQSPKPRVLASAVNHTILLKEAE